ncbi:MAG TPA: hypothetical protein VJ654_11835 [Noviherbaspirillum sp.]|nr:hypothetical protein [Noviherbaspirillum sp.]
MFSITRSVRFDDVDEDAGYEYHGWSYDVESAGALFKVRRYEGDSESLTVISPTDARSKPEARALVAYLLEAIGGNTVSFYDSLAGKFRAVDVRTMEFV